MITTVTMSPAEAERRQSCRNAVASLFRSRPGQWISAAELETVGGRHAWRTRISECRRALRMTIRNRQQRVVGADGHTIERVISEYQFVPASDTVRATVALELF